MASYIAKLQLLSGLDQEMSYGTTSVVTYLLIYILEALPEL